MPIAARRARRFQCRALRFLFSRRAAPATAFQCDRRNERLCKRHIFTCIKGNNDIRNGRNAMASQSSGDTLCSPLRGGRKGRVYGIAGAARAASTSTVIVGFGLRTPGRQPPIPNLHLPNPPNCRLDTPIRACYDSMNKCRCCVDEDTKPGHSLQGERATDCERARPGARRHHLRAVSLTPWASMEARLAPIQAA